MKKKISKFNLGIFQGRLTDSVILQKFPKDWEKEFYIANLLKLNHIEFFLEQRKNNINPFWTKKGRKKILFHIKKNFKSHKFVLCDNYIINKNLYNSRSEIYLKKILSNLKDFKLSILILPINSFYFENTLKLTDYFNKIFENIDKKIEISFEADADSRKVKLFLQKLNYRNVGITFDIGNVFNKNKNIIHYYKSISSLVNHIHIKDRDLEGRNVKLGSGKINLKKFFQILQNKKFKKLITLETYRKENSITNIFENKNYLKKLL